MESETDFRYFQELPGHKSRKTTEICPVGKWHLKWQYAKNTQFYNSVNANVTNKSLQKIKSPYDEL